MKQRILIVEDESAIRNGLVDLLVFKGYNPVAVADGDSGLEQIQQETFSLMILDVMLPGINGFDLCIAARECQPTAGIIMLTAKGQEEDIVQGFEAGCDDYITKPFSLKQLLLRIEALSRRIQINRPIQNKEFQLHPQILSVSYQERSIEVSKRDMEVLCYLYNARDRIVERVEMLEKVWGYRSGKDVETRCVDMHIVKLRKKLKALFLKEELIQTIRGVGYRLQVPP